MQDSANNTEATGQTTSATKCPKCKGSGMYIFQQMASEYAKANEKEAGHIYGSRDFPIWVGRKCPFCNGGLAQRARTMKQLSEIPSTFYDKNMSDFDWDIYVRDDGSKENTENQQRIIDLFIDQFSKWEEWNMSFYIFSRTKGSGKTFLASCLCNEIMGRYAIKTRFVNASQLIDISQSGDRNSYDEFKRNPMKLLYECKFLVIDDLGQKNTGGEWMEDILYKLLDYRMTNQRMTMITSNVPIKELQLNERITDRIDKLCMPFHLPELCVRSKETREARQMLLSDLGWDMNKKEEQ